MIWGDVEAGLGREHLLEAVVEFLAQLRVDSGGVVGELGDGNSLGLGWDGGTCEGIATSAAAQGQQRDREEEWSENLFHGRESLDILRVVVDVDFVLQLPEHIGGLLLHVLKDGDFVGEVGDGRDFGYDVVYLLFQVVIHK